MLIHALVISGIFAVFFGAKLIVDEIIRVYKYWR